MKFLDICAGIGGFRLALERAGHECVGFIEKDQYARKSYKAIHGLTGDKEYSEWEWHNVKSLSNKSLRKLRRRVGQLGAIAAGIPCQTFSFAGKRKGFADTRGTIFFDVARAASILEPRYLLIENVKGLLNHDRGVTFEIILRTMDELGYDVEWEMLNSKDYIPQNRERIIIIGHLRGAGTRKIFPLERSDSETFEANQKVTCVGNVNPSGRGMNGGVYSSEGLSPTLTTNKGEGSKILLPVLTPERINKNQNGRRFKSDGEEMFTLTAQDRHGVAIVQKPRGYNEGGIHEIAPTLSANSWQQNNLLATTVDHSEDYQVGQLLIREATEKGYAEAEPGDSVNLAHISSETRRGRVGKGIANTLLTDEKQAVVTDELRIRRLTPRECWRLQTFPDWAFDRAAAVNSDSQLYKQAGNSVTVDLVYDVVRNFV